jgi:arsenate reductase
MESLIISRLGILGHPQRLAVFRLLMRRYPDQVTPGELTEALGLKPSTLSAYLAALMNAGLVTQTRAGTSLRYAIAMEALRETFDYLLHDCCRGRPEICTALSAGRGPFDMAASRCNVLFICTGNSARSIFAEALLRREAGDRFEAFSAGTQPRSAVNPVAVEILRQTGNDPAPLRAKHLSEFQGAGAPAFDFVFTVCDEAANEDCPAWPGQPVSAHWGLPDPVRATGSETERGLAFREAYGAMQERIRAFAALPLAALDRLSLQRAVDAIGRDQVAT